MKHCLTILFSCLLVLPIMAQRLNVGLSGGWNIHTQTNASFNEAPINYVYNAPFANVSYNTQGDDEDEIIIENRVSPYNQVRIAKLWGVKSTSNTAFNIGGYATYALKNDFRIQLNTGVSHGQDRIYYGFQNMVVNQGFNTQVNYIGRDNYELFNEDFIKINHWYNFYNVRFNYELPIPMTAKISLSVGYKFRFQWSSNYDSEVKSYADSLTGIEKNEFNNIYIFQERLFQNHRKTGFNHFIQLGTGIRFHEWSFVLDWFFSPFSSVDNYKNHQYFQFNIQYDLFSIPLFK